jgi:polysaccharide biosynthesis protein PslG
MKALTGVCFVFLIVISAVCFGLGKVQVQAPQTEIQGKKCWTTKAEAGEGRYLYAKVVDPDLKGGSMKVNVIVTALDTPGILQIDYDSDLFPWASKGIKKTGTGTWKKFFLELPNAGFMSRCNGQDFRLVSDRPLSIADISIQLVKRKIPADKFPRHWSLENIPRFGPETRGFAFAGSGKMTKEIFEREMKMVRDLGFGWVRPALEWAEIEPEKGKFNWEMMDFRVACAKKYGLKIVAQIGFDTMWAADAPDSVTDWSRSKYPPKKLSDLADYVTAMVTRYKKDIKYWEGWNEMNAVGAFWKIPPSGRDPFEHYVAWQRTMYLAAKKADPDCVVLTGGFAGEAEMTRQMARYYEKGLRGTFDVMNIHCYPADPRDDWMPDMIEGVIRVMRHYGDGGKKIWITETGWPVANHPYQRTEAQQAEWTPWLWAVGLSFPQVERIFFFELRDRGDGQYFGWYGTDFKPRPVVRRWEEYLKTYP